MVVPRAARCGSASYRLLRSFTFCSTSAPTHSTPHADATARALADRDEAVEAGPRRADVAARDRGHSGALIDLALAACGDERAAAVLHTAYTLLMEQADAIAQPDWRRSFLEHIAVHRVILAEAEPLGLTAQEAER